MILGVCKRLEKGSGIHAIFWRILFIIGASSSFGTAAIVYLILNFLL